MLDANRRFYDAFERADLDSMSELWIHDDEVSCTHPGWGVLHGWAEVASSWFALFQGSSSIQFILTDERVRVVGQAAWVTVDENLIGPGQGQTVSALNLFERVEGEWRMRAHHGSTVAPRSPDR